MIGCCFVGCAALAVAIPPPSRLCTHLISLSLVSSVIGLTCIALPPARHGPPLPSRRHQRRMVIPHHQPPLQPAICCGGHTTCIRHLQSLLWSQRQCQRERERLRHIHRPGTRRWCRRRRRRSWVQGTRRLRCTGDGTFQPSARVTVSARDRSRCSSAGKKCATSLSPRKDRDIGKE